ncbi:MAG: exodeoxyribonuclease III [Candidatus Goldiibacteriota bacterium]
MKLLSWNVNGIRAVHKKGMLLPLIEREKPDILCLQETKAEKSQLPPEITELPGYFSFFESSKIKKGYSGTAIYSKIPPEKIETGFGEKRFDEEGRIQTAEFKKFTMLNIYFPNGKQGPVRLAYKMDFYKKFLKVCEKKRKAGRELVICGDVNTAHKDIDLARPGPNRGVSGFLPEETEFLDMFIGRGYIDTFREFEKEGGHYTWWDVISRARERDVGWRIDYFYITPGLRKKLKGAFILKNVMGSDHCPVGIIMDV